jgi:hypothetical protein
MNNNTQLQLDFIKRAALYIAESNSLAIGDALSFVYNSETFRLLEDGELEDKTLEQLLEIFKKEMVSGKV